VAENAGLDSAEVLNKLRKEHFSGSLGSIGRWAGVDVFREGGVTDTFIAGVWEPAANKLNSIAAATEAACCILSIDETVRNPQSEKPGAASQGDAITCTHTHTHAKKFSAVTYILTCTHFLSVTIYSFTYSLTHSALHSLTHSLTQITLKISLAD
jgi:hypothetical protein